MLDSGWVEWGLVALLAVPVVGRLAVDRGWPAWVGWALGATLGPFGVLVPLYGRGPGDPDDEAGRIFL